MANMNADAVNFEINRLQECCVQYRAQLAEHNGWIETWFSKHNSSATPFAAAIEEQDRALAHQSELQAEVTALRGALEWYGREKNWQYNDIYMMNAVQMDRGQRAREALEDK